MSFTASSGEVTSYTYTTDVYGAKTRIASIETKVNNTTTAKSTFAYTDDAWYPNGLSVTKVTRTDYSASSTTLVTETCVYRADYGSTLLRNRIFAITGPDGVRKSFVHEKGTWSGSPATFSASSSGTATRISKITGSTNSSAGSYQTSHNGKDIEGVYLVSGKSTLEVTIRDERSLTVQTQMHVWNGSSWTAAGSMTYTYDFAGQMTKRESSTGAIYEAVYSGGLKTQETDENGVVTDFAYDNGGRLETVTRQGTTNVPTLVTKYTYNAAGVATKEEIGSNQTYPITTNIAYDDAGRVISVTPPALSATTHSYNVASRTHTVTRPDGSTLVETRTIDGRLLSRTGTAVVAQHHTYGVETSGAPGQRWHRVDVGSSSSPRWNKSWKDWLGRAVKEEHPGFASQPSFVQEYFYDTVGRLQKATRTGYKPTLFQYNYLSQLHRSGLDINDNGALDLASSDRIVETETYLESYSSGYWARTDTKSYAGSGSSTATLMGTERVRLTGHGSGAIGEAEHVNAEGVLDNVKFTPNRSAKTGTRTQTRYGITGTASTNLENGLTRTATSFDGLTNTWSYDAYLRNHKLKDSRNNETTTAFVTGTGRPETVTDAASKQVALGYDTSGRIAWRQNQRGYYARYSYNDRSQVAREWGGASMPSEYQYDSYGQLIKMSTFRGGSGWDTAAGDGGNAANPWPSSPGTGDTTEWIYDEPSGLLAAKKDALGRIATQTYNSRGQTSVRTLAREVSATYGYDSSTGELTGIDYSDSTPDITYTYTRLGQLDSAVDATGTHDFVYDSSTPWRLDREDFDTFYGSKKMTRLYEARLGGMAGRADGFKLGSSAGSNSDLEHNFGYTANGRFEAIMSGYSSNASTRTFRYGYLANSRLIETLSIDGGHAFTVTRVYESTRNLVTSIDSKWSTTSRVKYDFTYDDQGFRSTLVQSGDVFADYGDSTHRKFQYNGRGELIEDAGYMNGTASDTSAPLPGRLFQYAYDNAGNRTAGSATGLSSGIAEEFTTNAANQYVTKENNAVAASGTANNTSNDTRVAVKGRSAAAGRQGRYWHDDAIGNNANAPWYGSLLLYTAKPGGGSGGNDLYRSDSRTSWLAAALQRFEYDEDGNLITDGVWDYGWDAENRLAWMQTTSIAAGVGFPNRVLQFKYDYAGRRVQKRVINASTSAEITSRRYLYDGWNLVAEFEAPSGTSLGSLVRSYTWGLDIVHSVAESGGVGALLQITDHGSGKTFLPTYDANGNVAALLNASSGAVAATYEYSPYGEALRAQVNDSVVADQPFRFSTKFTDVETGLVYYGHRYYDPRLGRFINRDPIEESGGLNLYASSGNNLINRWDILGCNSPDVTPHLSQADDGTLFTTYLVTAVDAAGNVGQWNFGSQEDADRWGAAWIDNDMSIIDPYLDAKKEDEPTYVPTDEGSKETLDLGDDDGYGGYNPFALNLVIDGVNVGTVSGSQVADFALLARTLDKANQSAPTSATSTSTSSTASNSGSLARHTEIINGSRGSSPPLGQAEGVATINLFNPTSVAANREFGGVVYTDSPFSPNPVVSTTVTMAGAGQAIQPFYRASNPTGTIPLYTWHTHGNSSLGGHISDHDVLYNNGHGVPGLVGTPSGGVLMNPVETPGGWKAEILYTPENAGVVLNPIIIIPPP